MKYYNKDLPGEYAEVVVLNTQVTARPQAQHFYWQFHTLSELRFVWSWRLFSRKKLTAKIKINLSITQPDT